MFQEHWQRKARLREQAGLLLRNKAKRLRAQCMEPSITKQCSETLLWATGVGPLAVVGAASCMQHTTYNTHGPIPVRFTRFVQGAMHALQNSAPCRFLKGQFSAVINIARYMLRYLSPAKHFARLEEMLHSRHRAHLRLSDRRPTLHASSQRRSAVVAPLERARGKSVAIVEKIADRAARWRAEVGDHHAKKDRGGHPSLSSGKQTRPSLLAKALRGDHSASCDHPTGPSGTPCCLCA